MIHKAREKSAPVSENITDGVHPQSLRKKFLDILFTQTN